jgi:ribosomal protein S18 acetylase RimI-like enzyme
MLKLAYRFRDLDFEKLMAVYAQSNTENGQEFYPNDAPFVQRNKVESSFEEYLREDFFRVKQAFYAVWEENGSYICALRMEPFEDGLLLEALETAPTHRRSGYATKLIEAVLASLPKGSAVYAHVHKRNTASLATHRRCGFTVGLDHAKYVDGTVSHYACTMKIIV